MVQQRQPYHVPAGQQHGCQDALFKCRSLRKAHKIHQEIEKENKTVTFKSSQKKIHRRQKLSAGQEGVVLLSSTSAKILDNTKLLCAVNPKLAHFSAFSSTEGTQCRVYSLPHQSRSVPLSAVIFFPSLHSRHHSCSIFLFLWVAFGHNGGGLPLPLPASIIPALHWIHIPSLPRCWTEWWHCCCVSCGEKALATSPHQLLGAGGGDFPKQLEKASARSTASKHSE